MTLSPEGNTIHTTDLPRFKEGYLPTCSCGWRHREFVGGFGEAQQIATEHEFAAKWGRLNHGPRRPALKTIVKQYLENATNLVYSPTEREQWTQLADEMQAEIEVRDSLKQPMPGQGELFSDEPTKEQPDE